MDLGLWQKDVAVRLGMSTATIRNWEVGRARPAVRLWPKLVEFLSCVPVAAYETAYYRRQKAPAELATLT